MKINKYIFIMCSTIFLFSLQQNVYGDTLIDPVEMKTVPAGEFLMGSKQEEGRVDERPQRKIYLDAYKIDSNEVSNRRYLNFIRETDRKEPTNPYSELQLSEQNEVVNLPVVQVTWYDAVDYCRWAGKHLPTEAQWEKAARGVKGLIYPWGSKKPSIKSVNFQKNWEGLKTLWPVSGEIAISSPYGLNGMAGNVREWVQDWYSPEYYKNIPSSNPQGPGIGILKVIKGGSWHSFKADIRSASRGKGGFALKTDGIGFRCAKSIKDAKIKTRR
jgi:sulfatase modifying factor 1